MIATNEATESSSTPPSPRRLWLKIPLAIIGFILCFELCYVAWNWFVPPWSDMQAGKIPQSALIKDYLAKREDDPKLPPLKWKPIAQAIPKSVSKVFIYAEDSRFYEHNGFDWDAIEAAAKYNWQKGRVVRGASTISQQTAKNLFLSLSRSPLRKWHEILLTYMLEARLNKQQILHAYLNIAEFGLGVYGIEAAAETYFHKSAVNLSTAEAVQLAASLPSPKKNNPKTRTRGFLRNERRVATAVHLVEQYAAQGKKDGSATSALPTSEEIAAKLREVTAADDTNKNDDDEGDDETAPAGEAASTSASAPAGEAASTPASTSAGDAAPSTDASANAAAPPARAGKAESPSAPSAAQAAPAPAGEPSSPPSETGSTAP